jgi:tetratricopeptide (TPR) repeat protein
LWAQARDLFEPLARLHPEDREVRHYLAAAHANLGFLFTWNDEIDEAQHAFQAALPLQEKVAAEVGADERVPYLQSCFDLALTYDGLGMVQRDPEEGLRWLRRGQAVLEGAGKTCNWEELQLLRHYGNVCRDVGILLARKGERTEALTQLQRAYKSLGDLLAKPGVAERARLFQAARLQACAHLGFLQADLGQADEALRCWQEALDVGAQMPAGGFQVRDVQETLALVHIRTGNLRRHQGQQAAARVAWQQGRDLLEQLLRDYPTNPRLLRERADVRDRLSATEPASSAPVTAR